ncbi:MAG TPA: capsule assembly Wzi family protein [Candidatus Saccharimonadales bacterium]|nr:capsule assembly Wzi family protein [Candidatus Saccharimonadales bacterium]
MKRKWSFVLVLLLAGLQAPGCAQTSGDAAGNHDSDGGQQITNAVGKQARTFALNVLGDQKQIWTSPLRLRLRDAEWLVPIAGIATGLIMTDRTASHEVTRNGHQQLGNDISNAGIGMLGLAAGSMYLQGIRGGNSQLRETGLLSMEAGVNALVVDEGLKYAFRRQRPLDGSGAGRFFQSGGASTPSAHAATAFAIATVMAREYPGPMTKILAFGTATGISLARVGARQHFPSDVFVGATMGYLIGRSVQNRHHDTSLDRFGTFVNESAPLPLSSMSSSYFELDSWIYPAIERLAARGIVRNEFMGLRPWTRLSVYRMLATIDAQEMDAASASLVNSLTKELDREAELEEGKLNHAIALDEVYSRTQYISGTPLNDGFHFGQTIANDFGRRYGHGWQQINGFEARAEQGRFSYFVRGEYQHSPAIPGYSRDIAQIIATQDNTPVQTYRTRPASNSFRLLDAYVSMNLLGHEVSVGKQSYWWGPDDSTAMMLGNNAEPFYALRINRTTPLYIPLLSRLLGPFRWDNFFGKLSGNQFPKQVFFYGQKINFSPTRNLELGFSRDAVIGGEGPTGTALTFGNFWKSFTSASSGTYVGTGRNTLGVRHSNFDFRYRLPGLRDWLTLYADAAIHDDVSPVSSPRGAVVTPGLYLAKVPGIPKLDLHVEGGTTDTTDLRAKGGRLYYYEGIYKDGYTNKGYLLSTWLGREGTGGQAWATYWFNPESTLMVGYRTLKVSQYFVPQGVSQGDTYAKLRYQWRNGLALQMMVQAERWRAPVLAATPQTNVVSQIQVSFRPTNWTLPRR